MSPPGLLAVWTLWRRELVRFFRQPSRIGGALGTPLVFWLLLGFGFSGSFRLPGAPEAVPFLRWFYPGVLTLVVLFAAIFSTISVIEDRREGFLQGVLVSPVSIFGLVAGKVAGSATLAWLQGLLLLGLAPLAGVPVELPGLLAGAGVLALLALGLTSVGFFFAWQVSSVQGFHAVMNLLLMPLWLLSGAFFPAAGAPGWMAWAMAANPLTYPTTALRRALDPVSVGGAVEPDAAVGLASWGVSFGVTAALVVAGFGAAVAVARRARMP